jgi:hypothetical protein
VLLLVDMNVMKLSRLKKWPQLAEAFEVSLDYMVGSTNVLLENDVGNKILDELKENDKQHVFALLDAFIKQTKFKSIM